MDPTHVLLEAYDKPLTAIAYWLSHAVSQRWPDAAVIETDDHDFDLDTFLEREPCEVVVHETLGQPDRCEDVALLALELREHLGGDPRGAVQDELLAVGRAVWAANARVEQPQVVVDLSRRRDR